MEKKKDNLMTVRIHEDLAQEVDRIVETESGIQMGFRSRADFVTEAVRDFIRSDMTPIYIPGELMKAVNQAVKSRGQWTSGQEFIIESVKLRLRDFDVIK